MTPSNSEATGLDMPAWKCGFCRRIAAVSVEPACGRPEMTWNVRLVGAVKRLPSGSTVASSGSGIETDRLSAGFRGPLR